MSFQFSTFLKETRTSWPTSQIGGFLWWPFSLQSLGKQTRWKGVFWIHFTKLYLERPLESAQAASSLWYSNLNISNSTSKYNISPTLGTKAQKHTNLRTTVFSLYCCSVGCFWRRLIPPKPISSLPDCCAHASVVFFICGRTPPFFSAPMKDLNTLAAGFPLVWHQWFLAIYVAHRCQVWPNKPI